MAYALVTALVVLPTASRTSVILRMFSGKPDIAAVPPALSVMGPKESIATIIPVNESIAMAATAIPYKPPRLKVIKEAMAMRRTAGKVDFIDKAKPAIILVP